MPPAPRARCFFDITVDGKPQGRIIFELFTDKTPLTAENFRLLCTGEKGGRLNYKGVRIHRIVKNFMIQGGDILNGNGTGPPMTIYGGAFKDENFLLKHDQPMLLSMANRGPNTNGCQFFITTQPAPHLDGKHVVFGKVIKGHDVAKAIESLPVSEEDTPFSRVSIIKAGELVKRKKEKQTKSVSTPENNNSSSNNKASSKKSAEDSASDSSSESNDSDGSSGSSSSSEVDRKRKKKRKSSKKRKRNKHKKSHKRSRHKSREQRDPSCVSDEDGTGDSESDASIRRRKKRRHKKKSRREYSSDSGSRSRSDSEDGIDGKYRNKRSNDASSRSHSHGGRKGSSSIKSGYRISESGRLVRGRGTMRYRSPDRGYKHVYRSRVHHHNYNRNYSKADDKEFQRKQTSYKDLDNADKNKRPKFNFKYDDENSNSNTTKAVQEENLIDTNTIVENQNGLI